MLPVPQLQTAKVSLQTTPMGQQHHPAEQPQMETAATLAASAAGSMTLCQGTSRWAQAEAAASPLGGPFLGTSTAKSTRRSTLTGRAEGTDTAMMTSRQTGLEVPAGRTALLLPLLPLMARMSQTTCQHCVKLLCRPQRML